MSAWAAGAAIIIVWCLFLVLTGLWLAWDDYDPGLAMVPGENPGQGIPDHPHETVSPVRPPGPATTTEGRRAYLPEASSADTGSSTGPGLTLKVIREVISRQTREAMADLAATRAELADHRHDCILCRPRNPCPDGAILAHEVELARSAVRVEKAEDAKPIPGQITIDECT